MGPLALMEAGAGAATDPTEAGADAATGPLKGDDVLPVALAGERTKAAAVALGGERVAE